MANKVHLNIHFPGGGVDPWDLFWVLFKHDVAKIAEEYQDFETIRARDAWRIAKAIGKAAEHSFDVCPIKRQYYLTLAVNDTYLGGPDGMWEELFDDADVEFSYEVKPMPGEVTDDEEEFDAA